VAFIQLETWNFSKNNLSKLVNSMKADFLSASLNLNIIIQKRKLQKKAHLWMMLWKQGAFYI